MGPKGVPYPSGRERKSPGMSCTFHLFALFRVLRECTDKYACAESGVWVSLPPAPLPTFICLKEGTFELGFLSEIFGCDQQKPSLTN